MKGKGFQEIPAGDRMVVLTPGGGGIGEPGQRDRAQIARDVADGLISPEAAQEVYGYVPPRPRSRDGNARNCEAYRARPATVAAALRSCPPYDY